MNVNALNNMVTWNIPYMVGLAMQLVCTAFYLVRIEPRLGLVAIFGYAFVKLLLLHPLEKLDLQNDKVIKKLDIMIGQIFDDTINMMTSVKLFSKEEFHRQDYDMSQNRKLENLNYEVVLRCAQEFIYHMTTVGIFSGILFLAFWFLQTADIKQGDLVAFFLLLPTFQSTVSRLQWHYRFLVREFADIERFLVLRGAATGMAEGTETLSDDVHGEVEFRDVSFCYPSRPGEPVLRCLNLKLAAGKVTAIVGDSGAGKSTLAKLLLRLYDPDSGLITIDGKDISKIESENLHQHVTIVNQNPDLFNTTLRDNVAYGGIGTEEVSDERIEEAAKLANCGFVETFRGGLDTFAGEGGEGLSGGQKQRIAIARAALRGPSILVLGEATSSLDTENEAQVQEALERLMQGRTTLVIAHRLSTIKSADEIVVLQGGCVVERGVHSELLQLGGVYKKLVNAQVDEHGEGATESKRAD